MGNDRIAHRLRGEVVARSGANRRCLFPYAARVQYVPPRRWPLALVGYTLAGLVPAALLTPAAGLAHRLQVHPGTFVALIVNFMIPLMFVATALFYPRPRIAVAGAVLALLAFTLERMFESNPAVWQWNLRLFRAMLNPIVTVGTMISGAIAIATCFSIHPFRRVGVPPAPDACHNCGYDLGKEIVRCPECGEVRIRRPE